MNSNASRQRRQQRIALYEAEERIGEQTSHQSEWLTRLATFPDPWLFDSEKLIREIDRCRELVMAIPNNADRHATHFQREIAITALYNLRETLRHLLALTRDGQRAFAQKSATASEKKNAPPLTRTPIHTRNAKRAKTAG